MLPNTEASFWAKATRDGPCLMWQEGVDGTGYGKFVYRGQRWRAHRFAWTIARGPIPTGLLVCHTCDRKGCIEPLHLFLGTTRDNTRDHVAKGRAYLNGRSGEANKTSVLTSAQVADIRQRAADGQSTRAIAKVHGVTHQHISRIVARRRRTKG
jgi:hypothetical protein